MLTLGINTASSHTEVTLLKDGQALAGDSWKSANDEAENLMPRIHELLGNHTYLDISKVVVVKGPGSFTGLRIGVSVANTIAHLTGSELQTLNTFDYWWAANKEANDALLIFAGKGGVYVSLKPGHIGELVDLPELIEHLQSNKVTKLFGDISEDQKEFLKDFEFKTIEPNFAKIITTAELTAEKLVKPLYIKAPNISKRKCST